jgi:hypothetical protein
MCVWVSVNVVIIHHQLDGTHVEVEKDASILFFWAASEQVLIWTGALGLEGVDFKIGRASCRERV